ncbi:hypothetical protein LIER_41353 [Lithospermum erythrorhizon]|uniref:Uncharacterized protein n=1 Tax=Lithospermum erythrorhizon TaxID=34254 RepID=A0AAV3RDU3_LITER
MDQSTQHSKSRGLAHPPQQPNGPMHKANDGPGHKRMVHTFNKNWNADATRPVTETQPRHSDVIADVLVT